MLCFLTETPHCFIKFCRVELLIPRKQNAHAQNVMCLSREATLTSSLDLVKKLLVVDSNMQRISKAC